MQDGFLLLKMQILQLWRVYTLERSDRRLTLGMLRQLNWNRFTVHQIFTEYLHMWKLCAKMVQKNFAIEQKDDKNKWLDLLDRIIGEQDCLVVWSTVTNDGFLNTILICETKWHNKSSPRLSQSEDQCRFVFFVHKEFVLPGKTVNQVERFRKPDIADKWILHHDHAMLNYPLAYKIFFLSNWTKYLYLFIS